MNILEYRAMVAQEEAQKDTIPQTEVQPNVQTQQGTVESTQPVVQTTEQSQSAPVTSGAQTSVPNESSETTPNQPTVFEINGQQVTLDELQKGYMRQSDYTRKTQELSKMSRQLEYLNGIKERVAEKPELAQQVGYDPRDEQMASMEAEYFDLKLQQEVNLLSSKYADFDVNEVLDFALTNGYQNLEHAYLLNKQTRNTAPQYTQTPSQPQVVDVEALKAQIRAELLAEQNTNTIITSGGQAPSTQVAPELSEQELKIAKAFGMTPEQYAKWR